jgi:tetratricopeptide (TPR) repeat protein
MTESARAPETGDSAPEGAKASRRRSAAIAALLFLVPGVALAAPPDEVARAFREPLHRIGRRGAAARQDYYRPLQVVALSQVDARFGSEPRNFRIACLAIGALCLGCWALFAGRLLGGPAAALLAALFVACHPVGIESYVWIAGISGPLSALFVVAALAFALASCTARPLPSAAGLGLLSLIALGAALLSKERAMTEPALLVATFIGVAHAPAASGRSAPLDQRRAAGLATAHLLLTLAYYFAWRPVVLGSSHATLPPIGGSAATQITSALANWPANLAWLFAPLRSSTSDVIRVVDSAADPLVWLGVGLALGSVAACWLCLRRGRPITALGLAWIWIAYAPTAGLVPILHANGERYLFLSAFGAALIVADLAAALARRAGAVAGLALALALLALLAQRTSARIPEWESNLALFQREIARDPAYREGYFLVAVEHFQRGRLAEAERHLRTLLAEGPEFAGTASYSNPLSVHELACSTHLGLRHYEAVFALERKLRATHPAIARAPPIRTCVGQAHNALGHTRQAVDLFRGVAGELGPETPPPLYLMIARGYLRLGEAAEARKWLARGRAAAVGDASLQRKLSQLGKRLPPETGSAVPGR